ncbi:ABC transporter ATP-binding protein [Streptomyces marispadix]|uniref:ATP-binding cassette domain-containing protein n=1 Tax=Streptomyces marispadix TaxID=2922868 RepID=A0ABS9SUX1_9ACTN|nr:ATP-binding cassette domain-containing protein [Streptomyces marispadix]MCH6160075.1 ATP-binding cassette domain-containing protein [Streptomyces marispadix]
MIRFEQVSVTYDATAAAGTGVVMPEPALHEVDLEIPEGELCLLVGPSGVGKSTLLGTVCGLVPHFTGGTLHGRVTVAGRDTRTHKPRELADVVGTVGQDPLAHFVTDTVEDELAYGMESLGLAPATMRRRVEETLDLLGLEGLRDRPIATLSGGQRQRVAIGSVLTPHPRVLVLDEPTSALDPAAAEEVLAVLQRLVHDLGTTVLMAEHRLERVVHYADRVLLLSEPGAPARLGDPAELMALSPVRPPVVELGLLARWSPLPLSIRDARRKAGPLRDRLAAADEDAHAGSGSGTDIDAGAGAGGTGDGALPSRGPAAHGPQVADAAGPLARLRALVRDRGTRTAMPDRDAHLSTPARDKELAAPDGPQRSTGREGAGSPTAEISGVALHHGRVAALRGVDLTLAPGETVALMGRNGAGKSTLLNTLMGVHAPDAGSVTIGGPERLVPSRAHPRRLLRYAGLVPQEPRDLLYADTVSAECTAADTDAGAEPGTCRALVAELLPGVADFTHPRDLSEGQRLALALAVILTARPRLLLLDEPTRGLDYAAKARLVGILRALADEDHTTVLATHDVELAAEVAHRVVILAQGEIVADGPAAEVVTSSPAFAPQVAKVLAPEARRLTVAQVRRALGERERGTFG